MTSAPSFAAPGVPPGFPSVSSSASSSSSSSSSGDFAEFQARVLGLSMEYQAFGRWFVASGGSDFPAYLSVDCLHLYSDFRIDFSSGSSCFLVALASSVSLPPPSSAALSLASSSRSPFPSTAPAFSSAPLAPSARPPPSFAPSFPSAPLLALPLTLHSVRFPPVSSSASQPFHAWGMVPGGSGVVSIVGSVAAPFRLAPPVSAPSLFWPFAADSSSVPVFSAPLPSTLSSSPSFSSSAVVFPGPSSAPAHFAPPPPPPFAPPDELPDDVAPDALPCDLDPAVPAAVPDFARSEFCALFEDFFGSSAPPPSPVFLNWFEMVRTALFDADSRMASFLATGRGDFSFLPPRNSSYAVRGDFASGHAAPVNLSLLSLFDRQLKPSHLVGMSIWGAAALEGSVRAQSETLSHSMWILSGLLAFVRLQNFALEDSSLFNTLVTSLSKSLAHQASLTASHTAFLTLKHRQFYLSHLPAYFSDVNKRSLLSALAVCADFLFSEADVARLLSDTQTSSSLWSQQALVDVASRSAGSRFCRSSPRLSPARQSPSLRRESGSPARGTKRVRFDSPAPNSALKPSKQVFRR